VHQGLDGGMVTWMIAGASHSPR
ncbi:MAG: hypothetical protein QOJ52_960, partial [Acidimicrobiaceae bacterium]|nr:hypothetical protein [Acidimicrobiaceae bacterium]